MFTIGKDPKAAVKTAVMCEDVARSVHIARQLGEPLQLSEVARTFAEIEAVLSR